jgi:hypothetical protein
VSGIRSSEGDLRGYDVGVSRGEMGRGYVIEKSEAFFKLNFDCDNSILYIKYCMNKKVLKV